VTARAGFLADIGKKRTAFLTACEVHELFRLFKHRSISGLEGRASSLAADESNIALMN
jgi:hypothetical protein